MSNTEKLYNVFAQALRIDISKVSDNLAYQQIAEWDSVAHMALVAEIETAFDVMLDTDDILALSTVGKAKDILAKYNVTF
jgi:acyl carrier protein